MRYFKDHYGTIEELKVDYRENCKKYHPDLGGDTAVFQEMSAEFEKVFKNFQFYSRPVDRDDITEEQAAFYNADIMEIVRKVWHFEGIVIEIIGSWIWITGKTYEIKDQLSALHFFYSKSKRAWL